MTAWVITRTESPDLHHALHACGGLVLVPSKEQAEKWLSKMIRPSDRVLYRPAQVEIVEVEHG